ncbi:lysophospholipid acyltransferase family protein [Coralliovum pocilloporae]|uniref:lysophospholipid acyltransferase family protein n=1 Tax=Coralliovum pocilloporae TaxID=3066369 RepID=UPI003307B8A3
MKFPELSYASPSDPFARRMVIRLVEGLSGRNKFLPLYAIWKKRVLDQCDTPMSDLLDLIRVTLSIKGEGWPVRSVPKGPLVIVANHPFGIGDGIALLSLAEKLGRPYKVMIHSELLKVPEIRPYSLPVDFSESREALQANIATKKEALRLLAEGTTIVVFPAGGVATAERPLGQAVDLPWKTFVAKLIQASKASVMPVYFEGQNGPLFHLVSKFSQTLRLSLLIREFKRLRGRTMYVRVGALISFDQFEMQSDRKALTDELYRRVHELAAEQQMAA